MAEPRIDLYWVALHADGAGLPRYGMRMIGVDPAEMLDGFPAPRCTLHGCTIENHRMQLVDAETFDELMDSD